MSSARAAARPLDVLVVDDSAVARQMLSVLFSRAGGFSVRTASDPLLALERMKQRRPDVIVLDLELPRMRGIEFLRRVMAEDPVPVVICSAFAPQGTDEALQAMEEGAVGVISKPQVGLKHFFEAAGPELIDAVRGAAEARVVRRHDPSQGADRARRASLVVPRAASAPRPSGERLVVVGASAGGTDAIRELLDAMPPSCPPIAIVQHMPAAFTAPFAKRLAQLCDVEVREATHGDRLARGVALIAPGDRHMIIVRRKNGYAVELTDGPAVSRHRPSVDVLFRSAAAAAGARSVGVILTGMGDDGADGLLEMRRAGCYTIAQDRDSCVVFGMPRAAIARGAAATVAPLGSIAELALRGAL